MNKKYSFKAFMRDIVYDIIGCFLYAIGIGCFAKHANFAPGGLSGLSIIVNHLTGLPIGTTQLFLNIPLILISFRILGKVFLLRTFKTMLISTFMLDVVIPLIPAYTGSQMLAAIFTGIFTGLGMVTIFLRGGSTGGTDFLTLSIKKKKPHFSIGSISISIDIVVLIIGGIAFKNIDATLYGAIAVFVGGMLIDKIMYGAGAGKMAMIITDQGKDIAKAIGHITGRGCSLMKITGAYTGQERDMVICAMSKNQVFPIRRAAHEADPDCFVMITSTDEVFGQGFLENKD